jgi:hypothetical protein
MKIKQRVDFIWMLFFILFIIFEHFRLEPYAYITCAIWALIIPMYYLYKYLYRKFLS